MRTLLFVDDEPKVLQGLQRQLHGLRNEWKVDFVDGAAKALGFMSGNPVDVIVTDMKMPGMDGAQLLTEVMNRYPNTVRLVLSGHADRESVLRLLGPAHQYLSKPCDPEELRNAVMRALNLRDLLANPRLKQLAGRMPSLPVLPSLHNQLTAELQKDEPSIERIGDIVSKDMGMTSKVLQLVNSAFFGLPQQIADAHEAVLYLGITTVRSLVLFLQLFSQYEQRTRDGFSLDELARKGWMTALLARRIAEVERCDPKIDDQCFLAGLLHDLGQLILASGLPDQYERVLEMARAQGRMIWEVEQAEFGSTHAEVGGYLLGLWGLPNPVVEAVAFHHRPASAVICRFSPTVAVHVASSLTHEHAGLNSRWPGDPIDLQWLAKLGLDGHLEQWKEKCLEGL